ncbi:MAG: dockerin type I repeat-containing protein [Ruminococcus sp.]|nr:dockerin type I repeat-containing protein [Ruminococcus sp.]
MNKKLKRMLATVSAVAMCAVSVVSTGAGAKYVYTDKEITSYTTSFIALGRNYHLCQELIDYYADTEYSDSYGRIYICDEPLRINSEGKEYYLPAMSTETGSDSASILELATYTVNNEEELLTVQNILSQYDIEYEYNDEYKNSVHVLNQPYTKEFFEAIQKIKDETSLILQGVKELSPITVTDVVNEIEPTLSGDTDCDGKVNINDAVFVMQSIANPDKYQLSEQGKANADIDGNGLTLSDAVTIQEMAASHLYD